MTNETKRTALIVAAAALASSALTAAIFATARPRYQLAAATAQAWRLDTATGEVSVCRTLDYRSDTETPACSPWGGGRSKGLEDAPLLVMPSDEELRRAAKP